MVKRRIEAICGSAKKSRSSMNRIWRSLRAITAR